MRQNKDVGKIECYEKKIALNSDKKRFWDDELASLKDRRYCDSLPLNASLVAHIIANKCDAEWFDEEETRYQPESEL